MKLSELQPRQSGVDVTVNVIDKGEVREFTKFGRVGRVCTAIIKDDSAQMNLSLWNDDVDKINVGDRLKLTNCFVNEWQGEMQLTTGRAGKIEVLDAQQSLSEEEPKKPEPEEEPETEEKAPEEPEEVEEIKEEKINVEEEFIE